MQDPVVPFDLWRMFLGDSPPLFYLEIVVRTAIVYAYALLLIRWVGGRGIAQMSTVEFLLVIALGSAVGDAMFYPEVPLLHAMLVITVVVLINKGLDTLIYRFAAVERLLDGKTADVIRNGVIVISTLRRHKIGKSELFESLREQGFRTLGEVRHAYLETSGRISVFRATPAGPGLSIEPAWDVCPPKVHGPGTAISLGQAMACCGCGSVVHGPDRTPTECPHCNGHAWTDAAPPADKADPK